MKEVWKGAFMGKNEQWVKRRHRVVRNIAYVILYPYARLRYGATIEKFAGQEDRPYLILYNHQTRFDQFFVGMAFSGPVYYLASEDIFSNGLLSSLIRWLVAPIPIKKQTTDLTAIRNCIQVANEGGTIAIAPEGNRTYSGKTEYMAPTIASLAKKLGMPIALYKIEGGYGVQPRWSDVVRKGRLRGHVSEVIMPEEYKALPKNEFFARIKEGLYVNEAVADSTFIHSKRAEYLERVVYVCPFCGLSEFESRGAVIECKHCHRQIEYTATKELAGIGFEFPFHFVNDWYEYQKDFVRKLDLAGYTEHPMYEDEVQLSEVIVRKKKNVLRKSAKIDLYGNRIEIDPESEAPLIMDFEDIHAMSVLGKNKVNIYIKDMIYQLKGSKHFNGIKYVNIYFRYKNIQEEGSDGQFLGL